MRPDILGVQAFVAVAELGSFQRAAEYLHLSQTALSRRLKKLEDALGVQLIIRTTRSLALSRAGSEFLPRVRRTLQDLTTSLQDLQDQAKHAYGNITIGCLPTVAARLLPPIIRQYGERHPRNRVQVLDWSATEIREAVLRGEAEFGITIVGARHQELETDKLFTEPMVAVCPAAHPLARRASLSWKNLEGEPLIGISALTGNRILIDAVVQRHRFDLRWVYEVQHQATAAGLVSGGAGIAILPLVAVDAHTDESLRVVALKSPQLSRTIGLIKRRAATLSPAAHGLYELVRTTMLGHALHSPVMQGTAAERTDNRKRSRSLQSV